METGLPSLIAILSIVPFLWYHSLFKRLFWFGDEWDLLDQIDRTGFWHWSWQVFAENFVPVFKLLWAGALNLGGGSYLFMLGCLWVTHALNTYLFGRLLRFAGLNWGGVFMAQILFSLPPGNWETLAWSVQWSAMLSTSFLLMAALFLASQLSKGMVTVSWLSLSAVFACCLASAWAFSRGVLTGLIVAAACLLVRKHLPHKRQILAALVFAAPSLVTAILIASLSGGNHHHMGGHLVEAVSYALGNFLLNPFHSLLGMDSWGTYTTLLLAVIKLALLTFGVCRATGGTRLFLVLAIAFDLGNAALLGIGRYHTGLETAISSRYQYGSLLATAPFVAFWLQSQLARCPLPKLRMGLEAALLGLLLFCARGWHDQLSTIVHSRGTVLREALKHAPAASRFDVAGIPSMEVARARELAETFDLD